MANDISEELKFTLYGEWDEESISLLNKFFLFYWYEWHTHHEKITEDSLFSNEKREVVWSLNGVNNQFSWINPIELTEFDDTTDAEYVACNKNITKAYDVSDWNRLTSIMHKQELIIRLDEVISEDEVEHFSMVGSENKILIKEL